MKKFFGFRFAILALVVFAVLASLVSIWLTVNAEIEVIPRDEEVLVTQEIKNEIYSRFFEIFVVVATLIAALTAALGIGAYGLLRNRFESQLTESVNEIVLISQARTLAVAFNEHSFSWFRRYEPLLQKFLKGDLGSAQLAECQEFIGIALDLAGHGLDPFLDLSKSDKEKFLDTALGKRAYINLKNQILYASAAQILVCNRRPSEEYVNELEEIAAELSELALDRKLVEQDYNWWEGIETAVFFRLHIGRKFSLPNLERKGIIQLRYLLNEQRLKRYLKPLPSEIVDTVRSEYSQNGFQDIS